MKWIIPDIAQDYHNWEPEYLARFNRAIGSTPDMINIHYIKKKKRKGSALILMNPCDYIEFVDARFNDKKSHNREYNSLKWLIKAVEDEREFSPLQVWPESSIYISGYGRVYNHEGRHRAWLACNVYKQPLIPVIVWANYKDWKFLFNDKTIPYEEIGDV